MSVLPDASPVRTLARRVAAAQTVWALAVALLWVAGIATVFADQDYTSGELLDHLLAWTAGEPLYPDPQAPPYRVLNYPPLGLAAVRALAALGMEPLAAGRLFGTAGVVAALLVLYRWLRDGGAERWVARGTTALAALSFPLLYAAGQFHLEGLAVAFTLLGVRLVWRASGSSAAMDGASAQHAITNRDALADRKARTPRETFAHHDTVVGDSLPSRNAQHIAPRNALRLYGAAGIAMATACWIKQTQLFPLLVVFLFIAVNKWRALPVFAAAVAGTGLAGAAVCSAVFGPTMFTQLTTYTVGTYSLNNLAFQLASHALPWLPLAVIAWQHAFTQRHWRQDVRTWYLAGTTALLLTAARVGSGFQYFMEWHLVVLLLLGLAIQTWISASGRRFAKRWLLAFIALAGTSNIAVASLLLYNWRVARQTEVAFRALCPLVPRAPALTPTENPGAARACGARAALHPFIIASLTSRSLWNEDVFVNDIETGRYPALLLPFNPATAASGVHAERWSPRVLLAMRRAYHPLQYDNGWWLLAPVTGAPGTGTGLH